MKDRKGIALIMAVGILAVLAAIATSFALNMRLEYKAAMNYSNGVKARYAAEAGVQAAILLLRDEAKSSAFDDLSEPWSSHPAATIKWDIVSESGVSIGSDGTAYATIEDEQRKVNINNASAMLMENLCDYTLAETTYISGDIADAIRLWKPANGYLTKEEIKSSIGRVLSEEDDVAACYSSLESHITVNSYVDENWDPDRSPVNINTADLPVLKSVLDVLGSRGAYEDLAEEIYDRVRGEGDYASLGPDPFKSWAEFDGFIDTYESRSL